MKAVLITSVTPLYDVPIGPGNDGLMLFHPQVSQYDLCCRTLPHHESDFFKVETSYLQSDGWSAMGDDISAQQFSQNGIDV